ncbi:hypothetical protein BS47DRAFT_1357705 [Hydnum rufescens UP504]|uniref:CxC1-like cysteine cluster associated with KDZ transposases domain-containing protein n=1 Tax=Hydnum rufescens UP504 TaxID=1448309 RepID=A0A9P6BB38_9AGAM|nr:hypothetical protein BS47DRAFT_1357705 [Hydnum rufescens UP504]
MPVTNMPRSAPVQLVQHGFFPCTLVWPTLALFHHIAPNERGWAATLTKYLKTHGYCFTMGDSFHHHFANALAHYQQLVKLIDAEVEKLVDHSQGQSHVSPHSPISMSASQLDVKTPVNECYYSNAQGTVDTVTIRDCPSIYLQSWCPLCFGSNNAEIRGLMVDSIVCIDVNFQLKRQRDLDRHVGYQGETGTQDPHITSPRMIELSQEALEAWEQKVQGIRPGRGEPRAGQKHKAHEAVEREDLQAEEGDKVERNLNMPNSTYCACGESFIAADGDRIKALTQYFSDTGILAMLCRHDIPIFLANMWTAGEKQFYVFALLDALIKHLPHHWRIGALYDIGCQIDQLLKKWTFCQSGWGIWSGVYQFSMHMGTSGPVNYGTTLKRMRSGVFQMEKGVSSFGSIKYLLQQFKEQQLYHSQPISQQSQTQGAHAIDCILSLQSTLDAQWENLQDLIKEGNDMVGEDSASEAVLMEWQEKVKSTKASVVCLENNIQKKVEELKLRDQVAAQKLSKLKKDKWITLQLNLHVLREQLL